MKNISGTYDAKTNTPYVDKKKMALDVIHAVSNGRIAWNFFTL